MKYSLIHGREVLVDTQGASRGASRGVSRGVSRGAKHLVTVMKYS